MNKKVTKTSKVLEHLREKGSITSMEAIDLYGATRLSAIIFNLKKRGVNISTRELVSKDRYDNVVRFAKYIYEGEE